MTPKAKKIITVVAIVMLGLSIYAYDKIKKLQAIFLAMTITPIGLPKKIDISTERLRFFIDIQIDNPTKNDLNVSGYIATLTKIKVYKKGQYIGVSTVNINEISIPHENKIVLHDVEINLPILSALEIALTINTFDINDYSFVAIVDVSGKEYEINNN